MDGCMANLLKYLLFGSNFVIFVIGCVVLGLGIYALVDGASLVTLVDKSGAGADINITAFTSAAYIFIVVAVFVVILTFFGCCGAIKESKCMLGTYFTLILVMFVVMIAGAVLGYSTSMNTLQNALEKTMPLVGDKMDDMDNANETQKPIAEAWNEVQTSLKCCGTKMNKTDDYISWEKNGTYPLGNLGDIRVPKTCCARFESDQVAVCQKFPFDTKFNVTGCFDKLDQTFEDNKNTFLIAGIVTMVIMFLNMLFAFAMCTMAN